MTAAGQDRRGEAPDPDVVVLAPPVAVPMSEEQRARAVTLLAELLAPYAPPANRPAEQGRERA